MTDTRADIEIRTLGVQDLPAVAALHADAFGPGRFARTAYRVREGAPDISPHCRLIMRAGELVGAVTMTEVSVGASPGHWLLGPLAIRSSDTGKGFGQQLLAAALQSVTDSAAATATVILVGDLPYYSRLKFEIVPPRLITLPGPVDPARLLIWRGPDGRRDIPSGLIQPTSVA